MLSKLRSHARQNVVAYLALFFALTGVAYAAGPLKEGSPAGGDLTGTYPNPTIDANKVTSGKILDGTVGTEDLENLDVGTDDLAPNAVIGAKILDGAVSADDLSANAVAASELGALPGARVFNSSNVSIANNTVVDIPFDSEDFDVDGMHDLAINNMRVTAKTAGRYLITGNVGWVSNATGIRAVRIQKNDGIDLAAEQMNAAGSSVGTRQVVTTVETFGANDWVTLEVNQNSGVPVDVDTVSTSLAMTYLGD